MIWNNVLLEEKHFCLSWTGVNIIILNREKKNSHGITYLNLKLLNDMTQRDFKQENVKAFHEQEGIKLL